jgi:YcxB-like protein
VSETLLADYLPEAQESCKTARSLGYEIALKSDVLRDTVTIVIFAVIGFAATATLMALKFDKLGFRQVDPIVIIILPVFVSGFLLWRLFRIWCIAPSLNECAPEQCKISLNDDKLIVESGQSRVVVPLERLHYYLERRDYFVFQLGQQSAAMIIPQRAFLSEDTIDQFRQILAVHGVQADWWTCRKLLG